MKSIKTIVAYFVVAVCICSTVQAQSKTDEPNKQPDKSVGVTIYNDNFAVVKDTRPLDFKAGLNEIKFSDVASSIDPTTVSLKSVDAPGAVSILEQNYDYDLVSTEALLQKYLGKKVKMAIKGNGADIAKVYTGVLMSARNGDIIMNADYGELLITPRGSIERISLADGAGGLLTRPTLVWLADSSKAGQQKCQVTYTTSGISWNADYTAILNDKDTALDLSGWVTINNRSGATYDDAAVKLIAGDVRRITPPAPMRGRGFSKSYDMAIQAESAGFQEKSFMEYHMYTLGRTSTIKDNQTKQIQLMPAAEGVKCNKVFVYQIDGGWWNRNIKGKKVNVKIEFENKEDNSLGMPLPKGKVRVFKTDPADGTLEFVGEDVIDHTPKKEKLSLYIGDAFDIVCEAKVTSSKETVFSHNYTREVEIRNRKDEAVTVFVDDLLNQYKSPGADAPKVIESSHKHEMRDAFSPRFIVDVEADSKVILKYSVRVPK